MLSDEEARGIAESCHSGADVHQPLLVRWIDALLADRRERIEHAAYVRQRLKQAFDYLTAILEPKPPATQREEKQRARRLRNN